MEYITYFIKAIYSGGSRRGFYDKNRDLIAFFASILGCMETDDFTLLPWHQQTFDHFCRQFDDRRMAHALLLYGSAGIGKANLACCMAKYILTIRQPARMMDLLRAGTHPDISWLFCEEGKQKIPIDHVRSLIDKLALTAQMGGCKLAIIEGAERMTTEAANALLKTLEEPPGSTFLVLLSSRPGFIPQTVKSRCQLWRLVKPDPVIARKWLDSRIEKAPEYLALASGAPIRAVQFYQNGLLDKYHRFQEDAVSLLTGKSHFTEQAAGWKDLDLELLLCWLTGLVQFLIKKRTGIEEGRQMPQTAAVFQDDQFVNTVDLCKLYGYLDYINRAKKETQANLNPDLFLEEIFMRWSALRPA